MKAKLSGFQTSFNFPVEVFDRFLECFQYFSINKIKPSITPFVTFCVPALKIPLTLTCFYNPVIHEKLLSSSLSTTSSSNLDWYLPVISSKMKH